LKVKEVKELLDLKTAAGAMSQDREIRGGYCGDLLSDVMANSKSGDVWLTMQSHQNIVAVAVLKELAAIVLVNGRQPDKDTIEKADNEGIPLLLSMEPAYYLAGLLYEAGIGKLVE
jgi:hypothetical protein